MSETKQVLVRDILLSADVAAERMSAKNPHRLLIRQMQAAIIELAQRANGVQPEYLASHEQVEAQAEVPGEFEAAFGDLRINE